MLLPSIPPFLLVCPVHPVQFRYRWHCSYMPFCPAKATILTCHHPLSLQPLLFPGVSLCESLMTYKSFLECFILVHLICWENLIFPLICLYLRCAVPLIPLPVAAPKPSPYWQDRRNFCCAWVGSGWDGCSLLGLRWYLVNHLLPAFLRWQHFPHWRLPGL